jgi:hypothetical protein
MRNFSKRPSSTDVNQCRTIKMMRSPINLSSKGIAVLSKNQNPQRDSRKKKKSESTRHQKNKDFILDGVKADTMKRLGKYDQLIDVHLIRFFEKKAI